jgi:alcohol dehydrogenase class IV
MAAIANRNCDENREQRNSLAERVRDFFADLKIPPSLPDFEHARKCIPEGPSNADDSM